MTVWNEESVVRCPVGGGGGLTVTVWNEVIVVRCPVGVFDCDSLE